MAGDVAIACATGGFKGAFIHGALTAFEESGFRARAYAAASSSVIPAAAAAVGRTRELGLRHWLDGLALIQKPGVGMSQMVQAGISRNSPDIGPILFSGTAPRFFIAASAVDEAGAQETQGRLARRRGRLLLLAAGRGDRSWIEEHLRPALFDSAAGPGTTALTRANFEEAAYASSRMLHAWDSPAWADGQPYIDAFYTCACPAEEVAELGYRTVIALSSEPVLYKDIFADRIIPEEWGGANIKIIHPDEDPADFDVAYTMATEEGLAALYQHGLEKGQSFHSQAVGTDIVA